MANIKQFVDDIQNAKYGEEVRNSIINAINKVNDDNNKYQTAQKEVIAARDYVQDNVHDLSGYVNDTKMYYEKTKEIADGYVPGGGTGGTSNYNQLKNKPSINGHELNGNQTAEQLGLQLKGNYLTQHQDISGKADKTEIPTKVSQLQNDKGYLTEHQSLADYAKKTELPTKISQLTNDSNYQNDKQVQNTVNQAIKGVTQFEYEKVSVLPQTGVKGKIYLVASAETADKNIYDEYIWVDTAFELIGRTKIDLSGYVTDAQLEEKLKTKLNTTDISEWAKNPTKPTYTAKEVGALPEGAVIPKKTSELTNDSGFLTEHQDVSGKLDKNQGAKYNGKILGIDAQGNVVPVVKPSGGGTGKLEPLTFTGGASGSYDGTQPLTVDIPTGGGSGEDKPFSFIGEYNFAEIDAQEFSWKVNNAREFYITYNSENPHKGQCGIIKINNQWGNYWMSVQTVGDKEMPTFYIHGIFIENMGWRISHYDTITDGGYGTNIRHRGEKIASKILEKATNIWWGYNPKAGFPDGIAKLYAR